MTSTNLLACLSCQSDMQPLETICKACGATAAQVGMTLTIGATADTQIPSASDMSADTLMAAETLIDGAQTGASQDNALPNDSMAHFKITDILGKGGMGAVYQAKDLTLERYVAIKMFRASSDEQTQGQGAPKQSQLIDEAKTICRVNHPNIVTIYDIARGQDSNFIVMEWVDGRSLNHQIPTAGLPPKKAIEYANQIIAAIACAHKNGIIHRDIKPQNIMVDFEDRIKVLDFGIAELLKGNDTEAGSTAMVGTPQYMAPEQIKGGTLDQRTDLFSFGIVLYEMLAGKKPFLGINIKQITDAITQGTYTPLSEHNPDLPESVITLVDTLLQQDPEQRYQDAEAVEAELHTIHQSITRNKNWWQKQHWLAKTAMVAPLVLVLGWSLKSVIFPPTTQELIARQMVEAKKIAILPFDNISGDPVLQIFNDGLASMLSSDLSEAGHTQGDGTTWVIPANEIRKMKEPSVKTVSDKYGVDLVLTGSIQHMGSTRSLMLKLLNGQDGRQLKSAELSIDANKLFEAHQQVRQKVTELLGWQLPIELANKFNQRNTTLDGAYKHYMDGKGYLYRFDQAGNTERAIESFEKAIQIDPEYGDAYVGLAESQLRQYSETKDVNWLKKVFETTDLVKQVAPHNSLLDYLQGQAFLKKGDYQNASNFLEKSKIKEPKFHAAYIALAQASRKLNNFKKALETLLTANRLLPNNNQILNSLGITYFRKGDYGNAIKYFTLLTIQAPNNHWAYTNISACYYLQGNIDMAIKSANESVQIYPSADGYSNLGTMYFLLRNFKESVKQYEKMISLNDQDFIKWGNLADAYRFANNHLQQSAYQQAIKKAEQALRINAANGNAIASNAYYLANIKERQKALFYAQQITLAHSGTEHFVVATAYARLNLKQRAIKHLKIAIDKNYSKSEIQTSLLIESLKGEPEFKNLMAID